MKDIITIDGDYRGTRGKTVGVTTNGQHARVEVEGYYPVTMNILEVRSAIDRLTRAEALMIEHQAEVLAAQKKKEEEPT